MKSINIEFPMYRTEGKKYKFLNAEACWDDESEDDDHVAPDHHTLLLHPHNTHQHQSSDVTQSQMQLESSIQNLSKKSADSARNFSQISRDLYRDLTRPNQFQRLQPGAGGSATQNGDSQVKLICDIK